MEKEEKETKGGPKAKEKHKGKSEVHKRNNQGGIRGGGGRCGHVRECDNHDHHDKSGEQRRRVFVDIRLSTRARRVPEGESEERETRNGRRRVRGGVWTMDW